MSNPSFLPEGPLKRIKTRRAEARGKGRGGASGCGLSGASAAAFTGRRSDTSESGTAQYCVLPFPLDPLPLFPFDCRRKAGASDTPQSFAAWPGDKHLEH